MLRTVPQACIRAKMHTSIPTLMRERRGDILRLARMHGARHVRVFGSVARGVSHADSDVDLLVEMEEGRSLLDHIALQQDLEELLGLKVDVVTEGALHPHIRSQILEEALDL